MQIHELPQHSGTPANDSDFAIDTGTNTYKLHFSALGEAIITAATATISGAVQTVKAAIEALATRMTTAENNIAKYSWAAITSSTVTENNITTRAKALGYIDDVIVGSGNRFRGIYFVGAFATLIGLPADVYYAVVLSNSTNVRSLLAYNTAGDAMYTITKRNGTWDASPKKIGLSAEPMFKHVTYSKEGVTVAAGATLAITASDLGVTAQSGYTPVAFEQIQSSAHFAIGRMKVQSTGTDYILSVKNTNTSSVTTTVYVRILYARDDMLE